MDIKVERNNNEIFITINGKIDTTTIDDFNNVLRNIEYNKNTNVVLDFDNVDYISSVCLRSLLVLRKNLSDERLRIINVNDAVTEILNITGFSSMLNFEEKTYSTKDQNFVSMLEKRVNECPNKIAYVYFEKEYTWKDVDIYSSIIASDLEKQGVKKGTHIGIDAPNSINWILTFFAAQKLGAIAVLLNFSLKPDEVVSLAKIGDILHLCFGQASHLLDFETLRKSLNDKNSCIENIYDISNCVDFTKRKDEYDAIKNKYHTIYNVDDPSVIIFTSGSSGKPKAVLSSAYDMLTSIEVFGKEFKITDNDRNLAFLPFFHVFGFATGISLELINNYVSYIPSNNKPETIVDIIDKYKCTLFQTVPTMMLAIVSNPSIDVNRLSSLRVSVLGGSPTTKSQMEFLQKLLPNNHFGNVYGMSENAAISVTKYNDTVEHITSTVGKPLEGIDIKIKGTTDDNKIGEICIRSKTMVVCYYMLDIDKQPLDEEGWLLTGDLGYIDNDGYLRLTGRSKDLIIRSGENISPNEIAEHILLLDGIKDTKVIGVPDEILGEEICACLVLDKNKKFDPDGTRNKLRKTMAKYKVPKYFVLFEEFPLLGSGKYDSKAIKEIALDHVSKGNTL